MSTPLLEARGLRKYFSLRRGLWARPMVLRAVDGVDLQVGKDMVLGVVGESGSGKSTLARLLLALLEPTEGDVLFMGHSVFTLKDELMRAFRQAVQAVFQDPFASLNPRKRVLELVGEPLRIHALVQSRGELLERVRELLQAVGLGPEALWRYPHEFSGGQRQRLCIARALAVEPRLIIADEPLSALDVSIQAQVLSLFAELRRQRGLSYVFISHDLRVVQYLSDTVAVMYLGRVLEQASREEFFRKPLHPYSQMLLASAPSLEPGRRRAVPKGDVPSPLEVPTGCPFHPRCPRRFSPCDQVLPKLQAPGGGGRLVACHLYNPY